jgi:hypothetical protein
MLKREYKTLRVYMRTDVNRLYMLSACVNTDADCKNHYPQVRMQKLFLWYVNADNN